MVRAVLTLTTARAVLSAARLVIWDFDGVIKESVEIKGVAFENLFLPYGAGIASRARQHHDANGGVSRLQKIPLYLGWTGEPVTQDRVEQFCNRFSNMVHQAVIDAPWVPGVREYLQARHTHRHFMLVTATPQGEIERILAALGIAPWFREVYGAPTSKSDAIRNILRGWQCPPEQALVVGDSATDLEAAAESGVPFLLRRTNFNRTLQDSYTGPMFDDLSHE